MTSVDKIKHCPRCQLDLDVKFFGAHKARKDKLQAYCKSCCRDIIVVHYEKHGGRHRDKNKEKVYKGRFYLRNKDKILEETKAWSLANKEKVKLYKKKWIDNNYLLKKLKSAEYRAKLNDIPFNLEIEDLVMGDTCPILNIPLLSKKVEGYEFRNAPSLDRIIPELGYTKGNVQIVSQKANTMKQDASIEELILFAEWVMRTFKKT